MFAAFEANAIKNVAQLPNVDGCLNFSGILPHILRRLLLPDITAISGRKFLKADAFAKFEQDGIFNPETAKSFKDNILSTGGTEHPKSPLQTLQRPRDATIDALLHRDGIK